jgi:hypothetical protein
MSKALEYFFVRSGSEEGTRCVELGASEDYRYFIAGYSLSTPPNVEVGVPDLKRRR